MKKEYKDNIVIIGKRVNIREINLEDIPFIRKIMDEPESAYFNTGDYNSRPPADYYKDLKKTLGKSDDSQKFIIENELNEPVGMTNYRRLNLTEGSVSIAIRLAKKFWNKGYGSEATDIFVRWLFNNFKINRVFLSVFDFNNRAKHIYEKCGFSTTLQVIGKGKRWFIMEIKREG